MKFFAIIICLAFWVASARGQVKVSGDTEMYSDSEGNRYISQFLWEDLPGGKVRLMQRLYPSDGRKSRVELGLGLPHKFGQTTVTPWIGWSSQDGQFILAGAVATGQIYCHKFVYIGDPKFQVSGQKPGWFYQRGAMSLNKWNLWARWDGTIRKGELVNSQPGVEWRSPKICGIWSLFATAQYDHITSHAVYRWGLRF